MFLISFNFNISKTLYIIQRDHILSGNIFEIYVNYSAKEYLTDIHRIDISRSNALCLGILYPFLCNCKTNSSALRTYQMLLLLKYCPYIFVCAICITLIKKDVYCGLVGISLIGFSYTCVYQ